MFSTYFDESQKQFNNWQAQFTEWQKKFFDAWLQNLPNAQGQISLPEAFDKALDFQQELVRSYLEAQEKTTRLMLDSQKKFWDDYFAALRKNSAPPASNN